MTKSINVNITGGTASIGAVSQGDSSRTVGRATVSSVVQQQAERAGATLAALAQKQRRTREELDAALAQLDALKVESTAENRNSEKGVSILKIVRDNFEWAYPAVKDFLKVAWPALLAIFT